MSRIFDSMDPDDEAEAEAEGYLSGQLLVAMPAMSDPRFSRTVIYLCAHNAEGAMGIVLNRVIGSLSFPDLLQQLEIDASGADDDRRIHFGGPVETGRGFVLHSTDKLEASSVLVDDHIALTSTVDILKSMVGGEGPTQAILALGYAGWGPGQLDDELQANAWLHVPADIDLVFDEDIDSKWERAMAKLGIDFTMLSLEAGHA